MAATTHPFPPSAHNYATELFSHLLLNYVGLHVPTLAPHIGFDFCHIFCPVSRALPEVMGYTPQTDSTQSSYHHPNSQKHATDPTACPV